MLSGKVGMDDAEVYKYANESRLFKSMWDGFKNGKGSEDTIWGLFNGVTWTVDHTRGRSNDTRLDSSLFGTGAALKQKAWTKAMAAV